MVTDRRMFLKGSGLSAAGIGASTLAFGALGTATAPPAGAASYVDEIKGFIRDVGQERVNVKNPTYGAKGDTRRVTGGALSSGSTAFTGPAATFAATDVGKVVTVQGAGASGAVLTTTIAGYSSATSVTLATAGSTTVSGAAFTFGTDDTAAIVAALTAAGTSKEVFLPTGRYTIRAASNGGDPITLSGHGGLVGNGGRISSASKAATELLCADADAGLVATASAAHQGFLVNGNHIASQPLLNDGGSYSTFIDVWVTGSTGSGWTILDAAHVGHYSCGSTNNTLDGLYIDDGANDLGFWHFVEQNNSRYGIHGDALVGGATSDIRFFGGLCDTPSGGGDQGVSKIYLRSATDWLIHDMQINGGNLTGPTVDLNQGAGYGIDFTGCTIAATPSGANPGRACIQVAGTPGSSDAYRFLATRAVDFTAGDTSVYIAASGSYRYGAFAWTQDATTNGAVAASGLPGIDTLLTQRKGAWRTASLSSPWTGTVSYRINVDGRVQLKGSASGGASGSTVFTLPLGYRPPATVQFPAALSSGLGRISATSAGVTTATAVTGTLGSISFDNVSFATS